MKKLIRVACATALLLVALAGFGQTTTASNEPAGGAPSYVKPETAEQRKARLGTAEDPGPNPDPSKHFFRFGHSFHIEKFERKWAAYDQPEGYVKPFALVPAVHEIYQQNNEYVWVWFKDPEPGDVPTPEVTAEQNDKYDQRTYDFLKKVRPEFTAYSPAASGKRITFKESSAGLPNSGSWRNSLAVADMNEDGCPDLIAPPSRKGNGMPAIFLGDCKGNWKYWQEAKFSRALDYGGVAVADFNKDGHLDIVFAVHLTGLVVFLGDGKGNFKESSKGLPNDFPTRRVAVVDVDHDGYPDIVATSEGPTMQSPEAFAPLRAYLNRDKGARWQPLAISATDAKLGGDWMSVGFFNRDRYPDFVASSIIWASMDVAYLSSGPKKWTKVESTGELLPSLSYYFANTTGHFTARDHDDAIISYVRYWPSDANPQKVRPPDVPQVTNIDRLWFGKDGKPHRDSIIRFPGTSGVLGISAGDFDGDGNLDIAYILSEPRQLGILLGDGHGGFTVAETSGITLQTHNTYDIKVADVNKDGRPDIIVMYEAEGPRVLNDRGGSIHVYLNQGVETVAPAPAKTATDK